MTSPSFDLRLVPSFVAVAEELHFGRAAARLRIAQPALSRQVARLEEQLGVALLVRSTRDVVLTPAGELFLVAGRDIVERATRARAAVDEDQGEIVVHIGPGLNPRINELVSSFALAHPGIRLRTLSGGLSESTAAVAAGEADVGFDMLEGVPADLGYARVDRRAAGVVCGPRHRLADRPSIAWTDLEGETLLMAPPGLYEGFNAFVRSHLRTYRVGCREIVGADRSALNSSQLAAGLGVIVLVDYAYALMPAGLAWVPIRPTNSFEFGVTWDPRRITGPANLFVRWMRTAATPPVRRDDRAAPGPADGGEARRFRAGGGS